MRVSRKMALIGAAFFFVVTGGVAWLLWSESLIFDAHPNDSAWRSEIARLRAADPQHDADLAIKRGDYRILGCYGVGVLYPGLGGREDLHGPTGLIESLGVRMFEDTSDAIWSDTHSRYIFVATVYANNYNVRLIAELERLGKLPAYDESMRGSPSDERDQSPDPAP